MTTEEELLAEVEAHMETKRLLAESDEENALLQVEVTELRWVVAGYKQWHLEAALRQTQATWMSRPREETDAGI